VGERTSDSMLIQAPADRVLDVILDLERYPEWADGVRHVTVTERDEQGRPILARYVVDARVVEIEYTLRYDHSGPHLTWSLEQSDVVRQLDGEYRLEPVDGGTQVTYFLEVDITIPVPGFLKKRAARVILETSLKGLRNQVATAD
jgi:ribosome-associated toxin RatA of RatAB toxin-antitoxin module